MNSHESALVVGLGEVGSAIYDILSESGKYNVYGYDIDESKSVNSISEIPVPINFLHIAFPCSNRESFIQASLQYIAKYKPNVVIVHSSVPPLTTRGIQEHSSSPIVYSPVRGKHPFLKKHLRFWPKWISSYIDEGLKLAREHLSSAGFKVKIAPSPVDLEIAKLWETVYRAIMIASWQEIHRICRKFGANLDIVAEFINEVHEVLDDRPVFYPDFIGGHCLIPNTKLLKEVYDSKLFDFILESNDLRLKEVKDPNVKKEIEKVKKIWLNYVPKWYYQGKTGDTQ